MCNENLQHHDRAHDGDDHAVDVQAGDPRCPEQIKQESADESTDDAERDIEPETLSLPVHYLASDKPGGTGHKKFHGSATATPIDCSGSILWKRYFAKALIQVNGSRKADIFLPSASDLA